MQKLINFIRAKIPNSHNRMVWRWRKDCGDERLRIAQHLTRDSIVLDVGGFVGQWSSDIFSRYLSRIYIFEAVPDYAEAIAKRFINNPNLIVHAVALGDRNEKVEVCIQGDSSSLHAHGTEKTSIKMIDVYDWFCEQGIKSVDLMKINIEGGEYCLLERMAEKNLISKVRDIEIQFHRIDQNSEQKREDICFILGKTHEITFSYPFVWERWKLR